MTNHSGPDHAPFHERITNERIRRGWTQEHAAEQVGMSLRSYGAFENGHSKPQRKNLREINRVFGAETTMASEVYDFPPDVKVVLDTIGVYLEGFEPEERAQRIRSIVRSILRQEL